MLSDLDRQERTLREAIRACTTSTDASAKCSLLVTSAISKRTLRGGVARLDGNCPTENDVAMICASGRIGPIKSSGLRVQTITDRKITHQDPAHGILHGETSQPSLVP